MKNISFIRTTTLIIAVLLPFLFVWPSVAGEWSALGSGMNNWVRAVATDGAGNLYAGGDFTTAGGTAANHVARWNGYSWSALGTGTNGSVTALAVDGDGNLYAAGLFSTAGEYEAHQMAKWDGSSWSSLGSVDFNGQDIHVLAVDSSGNLYVGGGFSSIEVAEGDHLDANYIAKWEVATSTWSTLDTGMDADVFDLVFDNFGYIYATGQFLTAGGVSVNRLAMWNGSSWSPVGGGVNGYGWALAYGGGNLYAGGQFISVGDGPLSAIRIARWDGISWYTLGYGVGYTTDQTPSSLVLDGTNLYAGGYFLSAGSGPANYIAKWDGSDWSALGTGTDASIMSLVRIGSGSIVASGTFPNAGGVAVNYIARWDESPPVVKKATPWLNLLLLN